MLDFVCQSYNFEEESVVIVGIHYRINSRVSIYANDVEDEDQLEAWASYFIDGYNIDWVEKVDLD